MRILSVLVSFLAFWSCNNHEYIFNERNLNNLNSQTSKEALDLLDIDGMRVALTSFENRRNDALNDMSINSLVGQEIEELFLLDELSLSGGTYHLVLFDETTKYYSYLMREGKVIQDTSVVSNWEPAAGYINDTTTTYEYDSNSRVILDMSILTKITIEHGKMSFESEVFEIYGAP